MIEKGLYWFRNNLRLEDNPSLVRAVGSCKSILPVFVLDSKLYETHPLGFENCGRFRMKFLLESVLALRENLRTIGSDLLIVKGKPTEAIIKIAREYGIRDIFSTHITDYDELTEQQSLSQEFNLHLDFDQLLIEPATLPFKLDRLPMVFSDFRRAVEKNLSVRKPLPKPSAIATLPFDQALRYNPETVATETDSKSAFPFTGGEDSAWERLNYYFWQTGKLAYYKKTRNGLIGTDYSSKFSPFLALGCLSPVSVFHEVLKFETEKVKNDSTYWLIFELLWREFFKLTSWKYGKNIFSQRGILQKKPICANDQAGFMRWMQGKTGDDFVDANMRELRQTGFMSNRGRQNVASYLVHDMQIDWRWGAAWFESQLIDYDCASNWCNWMYVDGVGNDPRSRKFNTKTQAENYDPSGKYRRRWLMPELF